MTLPDFLLARIAEDYADAMSGWRWKGLPAGEYERLQARTLAECKAKRYIVGAYDFRPGGGNWRDAVWYAMERMAEVHADHPDYTESWKP